jgi:hypothetical protein
MSTQSFVQHADEEQRHPEVVTLQIDENGSPVTLEAGSWFVCFVPGLNKQW